MATLVPAAELTDRLRTLPGWSGDPSSISATFRMPSFTSGIDLVVAAAQLAEERNHHPDIDIRWRAVTFRLVTHDAAGVTELDLELAGSITALAQRLGWV